MPSRADRRLRLSGRDDDPFLGASDRRRLQPAQVCAYGYDLHHLFEFLAGEGWTVGSSGRLPPLAFLGFLRRRPSRRPAQRLGLAVATGEGRLLAPASVQRVLAAASSRYEWAIAAGSTPGRMNSDTVGRSAARY